MENTPTAALLAWEWPQNKATALSDQMCEGWSETVSYYDKFASCIFIVLRDCGVLEDIAAIAGNQTLRFTWGNWNITTWDLWSVDHAAHC